MGGVRVREGSNHFIYNNYFEGIDRRSIYLQNESSDPLSDIHVYFNTIVNSAEMLLGGSSGSNPPTNVTIANNIFAQPESELFEQATGNETWVANLSFGSIGIERPSSGLVETDPVLAENTLGFFQPEAGSPVIASASGGYPEVPMFSGLDYDHDILLDLMRETRPAAITDRAIGASEFSSTVEVQPHVDEMNTGPVYLFQNLVDYLFVNLDLLSYGNGVESSTVRVSSNLNWTVSSSEDWITTSLSSGSGDASIVITTSANEEEAERSGTVTLSSGAESVTIEVNQEAGEPVILSATNGELVIFPNPTTEHLLIRNLPSETDALWIELFLLDGRRVYANKHSTKQQELTISIDNFPSGTYLMKIKLYKQGEEIRNEIIQKLVIK